ncbi:MAG TPA: hypothetical protein VF043_04985 [Ktedonobacteraceae bacterium]
MYEHELPRDKLQGSGCGSKDDLERSGVQPIDRLHRIVVLPLPRKEAGKQLPVHICRTPDRRHRHVPPQQDRRAAQDGVHQGTVDQPGHDEEAGQPVQREPALVLHEPALHIGGEAAYDRGQSWSERPQQQHHQPDQSHMPKHTPKLVPVRIGRAGDQGTVGQEQHHTGHGAPAVPQIHAIQAPEEALQEGRSGCEHKGARQQDDRRCGEDLTQIHSPWYTRRPQQHPEDDIGDGDTDDDLPTDLLLHKSEHCPNLLGEPRRSQRITCSFRWLVNIHRCFLSLLEP